MSFLRRSKPNRPKPESYQERLRALGRRLDDEQLRFATLIELPDGFLLKADEIGLRREGEVGAAWSSRTFWLNDADVSALIDLGYEQRGEKRDER